MRRFPEFIASLALALTALFVMAASAQAASYPTGFREETLGFTGLHSPTTLSFGPDGAVYVAEKDGLVKRFPSVGYNGPGQVVIDLTAKVNANGDHGLIGMVADPNPLTRRLFVLYSTEEALPGTRTTPPASTGSWEDDCPDPPGSIGNGCVSAGRLSRIDLDPAFNGTETSLILDWCSQFNTHSVGALRFGPDGQLYASGGDGANPSLADYGQLGGSGGLNPGVNPCHDPIPSGDGIFDDTLRRDAEGGALRSLDVMTPEDPTTLDGTIIRIDPNTTAGSVGNPLTGDANRKRIIAYGLRNPFRFALRPYTNELWIGDVGWGTTEEIDRVKDVRDGVAENFGWPCFEADNVNGSYGYVTNHTCERLAADRSPLTMPYFGYKHGDPVAGEACPTTNGSSISGVAFGPIVNFPYPDAYRGGLFFTDYARSCIWFAPLGAGFLPDMAKRVPFGQDLGYPVDLMFGPDNTLYYPDIYGQAIRHVVYDARVEPPVARITKQAPTGPASAAAPPLTVDLDGRTSSDPAASALTYAWDLDGDGDLDDSTLADPPAFTYRTRGSFTVKLRVTNARGVSSTDSFLVRTDNSGAPKPVIQLERGEDYAVGDPIAATGAASDPEDGEIPSSRLRWGVTLVHCVPEGGCHMHPQREVTGTPNITVAAADHPWPSYHLVTLTATDSGGSSAMASVAVHPRRSDVVVAGESGGRLIPGLALQLDQEPLLGQSDPRPYPQGGAFQASTADAQTAGADRFVFRRWSDGQTSLGRGAVAGAGGTRLVAQFDEVPRQTRAPAISGPERQGRAMTGDPGTWEGSPAPDLARTWERCNADGSGCAAIAGATGATYTPAAADVGRRLRLRVRASNGAGDPVEVVSDLTQAIAADYTPSPDITITGGTPAGIGSTVTYQGSGGFGVFGSGLRWDVRAVRAGVADEVLASTSGVDRGTFTLAARPAGTRYVIRLTAANVFGWASSTTVVVQPRLTRITALGSVAGSRVPGLRVDLDGTRIDEGTGTDAVAGSSVTATTAATQQVGLDTYVFRSWSDGPTTLSRPVTVPAAALGLDARFDLAPRAAVVPGIAGDAVVGRTLTVDRGTWRGSPAPTFTTTWERCLSGTCTAISGATATTLVLTTADVGRSIRARVTADNGAGAPVSATTAGTLVVRAATTP